MRKKIFSDAEMILRNREAVRRWARKHSEQRKQIRRNWHLKNKKRHIKVLGEKCQICGYDKCVAALEIHHLNGSRDRPQHQTLGAVKNIDYSKLILLCANCHREQHYRGGQIAS